MRENRNVANIATNTQENSRFGGNPEYSNNSRSDGGNCSVFYDCLEENEDTGGRYRVVDRESAKKRATGYITNAAQLKPVLTITDQFFDRASVSVKSPETYDNHPMVTDTIAMTREGNSNHLWRGFSPYNSVILRAASPLPWQRRCPTCKA